MLAGPVSKRKRQCSTTRAGPEGRLMPSPLPRGQLVEGSSSSGECRVSCWGVGSRPGVHLVQPVAAEPGGGAGLQ